MPTLVIDNVPALLYHRIQNLAIARHQTPAATVLEMLESVFRSPMAALDEAPLPQEPFLTEEMVAPCTIPRPEGQPVDLIDVADYVPLPHDLPNGE